MTNQCDHGQLARVCLLCEKDEQIRVLREAPLVWRRAAAAIRGDD